ncbi:MAG: alpha-glucan family phosphorylase [Acidimicrobiales bacterium]|nr:alpha-glucan family phosphorylase [Acidimicrobiales bacterium]
MKALQSFTVRPHLPSALAELETLAMNLRWSWDRRTRDLFSWIDPDAWDEVIHDPVRLLAATSRARLEELAADPTFLAALSSASRDLQAYLHEPRWFQQISDGHISHIGYFSPEFGIAEALPQYSGGLGVLAGDHLKAASDLGVPVVGIGLFYRHGYFRQALSVDGWQQERYPDLDPFGLAVRLVDGVQVTIDLAGIETRAQLWRADVGRVLLYLLDTDIDGNPDEVRNVTDRLYGGDTEHRLRQEILLGIGGVRALRALGITCEVFHTNEGHAGFLGLERIRELVVEHGLSYAEATQVARSGCLFTTHTPVPAGIDRFPRELIEKYFGGWAQESGVSLDELMSLGHRIGDPPDERFNMAVMGLRLAARSNGVSKLHGDVSRDMFADLWPAVPGGEVPITSITNGVHGQTWISPEMDELLHKCVGADWSAADAEQWDNIGELSSSEVWATRRVGTQRLVGFVRSKLRQAQLDQGYSTSDVTWTESALDPDALTICFARRFATYKRATLLLSQPERLKALLLSADRPVQFIFAGKAHPADDGGKELIRQIVNFSHDLGIRHRFAFLDDYDISVARMLYQGADVWLNTPRRPLEACGTSGEKAALNGALNCSILDGWWDEMFTGDNGWAITSADRVEDVHRRDQLEADSLFGLLEQQIVPLFYDRSGDGLPHGWVERMRNAWRTLGPQVTAQRMVRDYVNELYEPIAARSVRLYTPGDGFAQAKELTAWKQRVAQAWHQVHIDAVGPALPASEVGVSMTVTAQVALGALSQDDVVVQLLHGPVGEGGQLTDPTVVVMADDGAIDGQHRRYVASFAPDTAGRYGYTARVVTGRGELSPPLELGLIAWAN